MLRRFWQDMTTEDFAGLDAARVVAVLPVAAIEQHGPHLPLAVDAILNDGILKRTLELLPPSFPVTVLPALPIGRSDEHGDFAGTLSLSPETVIRLWSEVGDGVAKAGLRKLVLFNSHGGQPQLLDIVGRQLRIRHKMLVVQVNAYRLVDASGMFEESEIKHGIHGGAIETSMMLHLRPDLVRVEKIGNFMPASLRLAKDYAHVQAHGRVPFSWLTQDLNAAGACGDATQASAARGRELIEQAAQSFRAILEEASRMPLDVLKDRA
ncbi:MAG TPA: creatininase family protein [Alphaproteobacteria bacterium]|nr:creatininase family protein [Alphaproteobacteria bacterium]